MLHPHGVQEGMRKSRFVRGSRGARNRMVAPYQFRPATKFGHTDALRVPLVGALSCFSIHDDQRHEVDWYRMIAGRCWVGVQGATFGTLRDLCPARGSFALPR